MGLVAPQPNSTSLSATEGTRHNISSIDLANAARDTFNNRSAISPQAYPDLYGTLLTYTEGTPVTVEYFKKRNPLINQNIVDTTFAMERSSVHISYDLIHSMEIRIKDQLIIEIDPVTTETSITGVAVIYPGFVPHVGDVFYLKLQDNSIGVFVVNLTRPTSINKGTHHQIDFHMKEYYGQVLHDKLMSEVVEELHFDKTTYFNGTTTLLTHPSYDQLILLTKARGVVINQIYNKFYNNPNKTIVRPDGIYDAFVVEFLSNKISISDSKRDVCQISNMYTDQFDSTIWKTILDRDVSKLMYPAYGLSRFTQYMWDVGMSNIDNFPIVTQINRVRPISRKRLFPVSFDTNNAIPEIYSYHFSGRFYYALLRSYEDASPVTDITSLLPDMVLDDRIFSDRVDSFISLSDHNYHPISYFETNVGGNSVKLPDMEYILFNYLIHDMIDVNAFISSVVDKLPLRFMTDIDKYYYLPVILHLIDVCIRRIK